MSYEDLIRSALRTQWQHATGAELIPSSAGGTSPSWATTFDCGDVVVQVVATARRPQLEAGLAAAEFLAARGVGVAAPVRTRTGAWTVLTDAGAVGLVRRLPGRPLAGDDPVDQQWWGDKLGAVHRGLDGFDHPGLLRWPWLRVDPPHLGVEPWIRPAVTQAVALMTRLSVTDRLTYGVLHGDPAPGTFRLDVGTGRTGVVCWGCAATGPLVYDLAAAVTYAGGLAAATDLIDGYVAAGAVPADEIEATLPVLVRFRLAVQLDVLARRIAAQDPESAGRLRAELHRTRDALAACTADDDA